ncbi:MAG: PilZ domain-containing protein [Bryobacteraceae bacterium]
MSARSGERRETRRSPGQGRVRISFEDPARMTVDAELVDLSSTGVRVSHDSRRLAPGLEVSYTRQGDAGRARVVWTHILDGQWISGFALL